MRGLLAEIATPDYLRLGEDTATVDSEPQWAIVETPTLTICCCN
jgi:hypothetical protein